MSERTILRVLCDLSGPQIHIVSSDGVAESTLLSLQKWLAELFGSDTVTVREGLTTMNLSTGQRAIVRTSLGKADALIVGRKLWNYIDDPFLISERYPPGRTTSEMDWPDEPTPFRTAAMLETIHVGTNGPLLLGVTQAVVDGARVLLTAETLDSQFVRNLWMMLPHATRREAAVSSALPRHHPKVNFAILPELPTPMPMGYLNERMVLDYPEGRYEHNLQIAFEAHDDRFVQELLMRRSGRELMRMGIWAIAILLLGSVIAQMI